MTAPRKAPAWRGPEALIDDSSPLFQDSAQRYLAASAATELQQSTAAAASAASKCSRAEVFETARPPWQVEEAVVLRVKGGGGDGGIGGPKGTAAGCALGQDWSVCLGRTAAVR